MNLALLNELVKLAKNGHVNFGICNTVAPPTGPGSHVTRVP